MYNRKIAHKSLVKKILKQSLLNPELPNIRLSVSRFVKHLRTDKGRKYRGSLRIIRNVRRYKKV